MGQINQAAAECGNLRSNAQEAAFDRKAEKHFKSQRELLSGRDFRWNQEKDNDGEKRYRDNFDNIFPSAPCAGF
jgi:hypothetical protein